ncbi:TPA: hypothetical protein DCR49_06470 [Candidatus Delongbacteria bacterium]|nr:MAG: hypothetical protein A2Y39_03755 [Candidatus Delongbacteria bacterium GWF2_40_14]HAQ61628.1 hypothetical protein [Candidatus Delongbacteria bacterium]
MNTKLKGLFVLILVCALIPLFESNCFAQTRGRAEQKSDTGVADEGTAVVNDEVDFEEEDEPLSEPETPVVKSQKAKSSEKAVKSKTAAKKEPSSKESLLERETKRHENQMKQIKLMRKKANEQLKKAEEMESNELKKHDEAVEEIKES